MELTENQAKLIRNQTTAHLEMLTGAREQLVNDIERAGDLGLAPDIADLSNLKSIADEIEDCKTILNQLPGVEKTLHHNQQIKVESFTFRPVITVGTQKGYYDEYAESNAKYGLTYEEDVNEDYAYAIRSASCLTANYPGKAEELERKRIAYENAPAVENGEIVVIDGRRFKVHITGENYSDPIHFKEIK